jgi:hypothetical protein
VASARTAASATPRAAVSVARSRLFRRRAKQLRELYVALYEAVLTMQNVAHQSSRPWGTEAWSERDQRLSSALNEALQTMNANLPTIRVAPGSLQVCANYDAFY